MGQPKPFTQDMYGLDDVLAAFPAAMRPTKEKFKEVVEAAGCYRDLGGKRFMLPEDVDDLLAAIRAVPKGGWDTSGPARLLLNEPSPNTLGYVVFLGEGLDVESPVYIGWAPRDETGITDTLRLAQHGCSYDLAVLGWAAATPDEVDTLRDELTKFRTREDTSTRWFQRNKAVNAIMAQFRSAGVSAGTTNGSGRGVAENTATAGDL